MGLVIWALSGGPQPMHAALAGVEDGLAAAQLSPRAAKLVVVTRDASAPGLFAVGSAPLSDVSLSVEGIALRPGRAAALVSINGKPAEWVERGATRDGITLQSVLPSRVVFDTALGAKSVGLGEHPSPGAAAPSPAPASPTGGPRPQSG